MADDSSGLIWLAESDNTAPAALYSFDPTTRDLCPYSLPEGGAGYYPEAAGTTVWLGDVVNERILRLESASGVFTTWQLPAGSAPEDVALDRDASKLSVGQAARIAMARVGLTRPDVLLLDEPDASLDEDSAALVAGLTVRFAETGSVVRIRHHRPDGVATRRERLVAGRLRGVGDSD